MGRANLLVRTPWKAICSDNALGWKANCVMECSPDSESEDSIVASENSPTWIKCNPWIDKEDASTGHDQESHLLRFNAVMGIPGGPNAKVGLLASFLHTHRPSCELQHHLGASILFYRYATT
ncbi:hypothetical protein FRC02_003196 [Tulasnella sp. 418]|nr:hypothetical protein FRC02_003196 [Tulasnella sp. 418]